MSNSLTPRYIIIAIIFAWAIYALSPTWKFQNMEPEKMEELRTTGELEQIESRIIKQGLDLKGGMYIVLEADIPTLVENIASIKDERLTNVILSAKKSSLNPNLDFFTTFEKLVIDNDIKL